MGNWPGPAGDARQPTGRRLLDETDAVPAVLTHTARDGRDYWTPGPWRPDGTVGNTVYLPFSNLRLPRLPCDSTD